MTALESTLNRLADFEPSPFPVLSLYLDAEPDQTGRKHMAEFAKKQLHRKAKTFDAGSDERESFERDAERILELLEDEEEGVRASARSVVIFASHGSELFEVVELDAPVERSRLIVGVKPDLFPLAWLDDRFARYAVLMVDSQGARLFVFGLGNTVEEEDVEGENVRRQKAGGWSQSRFQRRRENARLENVREAIEALEEVVKQDQVSAIILSGDGKVLGELREELPQHLAELVADELNLDQDAPAHQILEETLAAFRSADEAEDEERARTLINEFRADGLACVGLADTLDAAMKGQVEEVLLRGPATHIEANGVRQETQIMLADHLDDDAAADTRDLSSKMADVLVTQARNTGATVRFLENETILSTVGGVGAFLRYRI